LVVIATAAIALFASASVFSLGIFSCSALDLRPPETQQPPTTP
jgi:hypothetical protein